MTVSLLSLWLPILLSAVAVFFASFLLNSVLKWHKNDVTGLPDEDKVAAALREFEIPPGDYVVPWCDDPKQMADPAFQAKCKSGPVGIFTFLPNQPFAMGQSLILWFLYSVVVSGMAAFAAGVAIGPGADYLVVFRVVSVVAFAGYAMGVFQASIWWGRQWRYSLRTAVDALVYAWLTAGFFGWLWP